MNIKYYKNIMNNTLKVNLINKYKKSNNLFGIVSL